MTATVVPARSRAAAPALPAVLGAGLVLLGAPGAGKGTQAALLAGRFRLEHVSTGALLRAHVAAGTPLGEAARHAMDAGELVGDDLVTDMVLGRLGADGRPGRYVLDGYPRSLAQARRLDAWLAGHGAPLGAAVHLAVPETEVRHRLALRAGRLGRSDDDAVTVRHRLAVFERATRPLLDHYAAAGRLVTVEATGSADEVADRILAALR